MACRFDTPLRVSGGVAWPTDPVTAPGSWSTINGVARAGRGTVTWSDVISLETTTPATDTEAALANAAIELDPEAAALEAEAALIVEEPAPPAPVAPVKEEDPEHVAAE